MHRSDSLIFLAVGVTYQHPKVHKRCPSGDCQVRNLTSSQSTFLRHSASGKMMLIDVTSGYFSYHLYLGSGDFLRGS